MPAVQTARRATARVKKMVVIILGVSTPSASMVATAGSAERANDASKDEAAKVVVVVCVWGMLAAAMVSLPSATFDEAFAVTFSFDAFAVTNPPPPIDTGIVTRAAAIPGIICAGR